MAFTPRNRIQGEIVFSKDGTRQVEIKSRPIVGHGTKRPFKAIEAQIGGIVDMDCARIPVGDRGGTFFGSPSPGSALVGLCDPLCNSLISVEIVNEPVNYDAWKRRISDYMSNMPGDVLQIEEAWVCSSSGRWYSTMPGWEAFNPFPKVRGANKTGFVKTKPLSAVERVMPLTEYVLDRPEMKSSAMVVASAVVNWNDSKWERMETRFMDDSGVSDLLKRVATQKNGLVPMRIGAGSIGIVEDQEGVRAVFLPILPSEVQLEETTQMAIDNWVKFTMRDMWIEIVSDIQSLAGVTTYRPSSKVVSALGIFSLGAVSGGVVAAFKAGMIGYGLGAAGALLSSIKDQFKAK